MKENILVKTCAINEIFSLTMEWELQKKTLNWSTDRISLDANFYAIGTLSRISNIELESIVEPKRVIEQFYDKITNGMRQTEFTSPNLYSTFCFLGIISDLLKISDEKIDGDTPFPIEDKTICEVLRLEESGWKLLKTKMIEFVQECYSDKTKSFLESPWTNSPPSSLTNSTSIRSLIFLDALDNEKSLNMIENSLNFIEKCKIEIVDENTGLKYIGFVAYPEEKQNIKNASVCPTYFIYKTFFSPRYKKFHEKFTQKIFDIWGEKCNEYILNLVKVSWCENNNIGGFRIGPIDQPILIPHTKYCLKFLEFLGKEKNINYLKKLDDLLNSKNVVKKILNFVKTCQYFSDSSFAYGGTSGHLSSTKSVVNKKCYSNFKNFK
ncbi:MAG: hypothetical protein QXJ06_06045 [Candidatus Aenigmatarchaeota archaeon]